MAGHSKWHQIKRSKGLLDKKRGALFTKLSRNVSIAAQAGGDPSMNPALALAIEKAKEANMTNDVISRAIKKGTGELKDAQEITEIYYEGYAPGGLPIIIRALTESTNRTVAHVRHIFSKYGGSMGNSGSVAHMFTKRGVLDMKYTDSLENAELYIMDSGAVDYTFGDQGDVRVITEVAELHTVQKNLAAHDFTLQESDIKYIPNTTQAVSDESQLEELSKFFDLMEDSDDIQEIYSTIE